MRNPNGYGSVVNLGKGRRKPWGARVTTKREYDGKTDKFVQKYKYIGYSDTRKGAYQMLAEYNANMPIKDNRMRNDSPTFEKVWEDFCRYKFERENSKPSDSSIRNYKIAYNRFEDIKNKNMENITSIELQKIFDKHIDKSISTVGTMKTVINQMYRYAKKYYGIEDISKEIDLEYTESSEDMHKPFTKDEISYLWEHQNDHRAQFVLMMIYSGVRPQEFVKIENKNVHLNDGYFIGGMKTESGKDRIIPIHSKTMKFFEKNFDENKRYLINKSNYRELTYRDRTDSLSYSLFANTIWSPYMKEIGMDHKPHDPRHTFATLMDNAGANKNCIKEIMGHKQTDDKGRMDVTEAVYIHKTLNQLKEEIEKI